MLHLHSIKCELWFMYISVASILFGRIPVCWDAPDIYKCMVQDTFLFGQYRVQRCIRSLQAYLDGYICYWLDTYERVHGMMHTPLIVFGSFVINDIQSCYLCHWKIWLKRGRSGAGMLTLNIGFSRMVWAPLSIVAATAHISNTYHQSGYEEGMGQTYVPLSRKNAHFKALFLPLSPDRFFMRPSYMDTTLMWFM